MLLTRFVQRGSPASGSWSMPGGGMEWGERPETTALRELLEETGFRATLGPLLGVYSEWIEGRTTRDGAGHVIGAVYAASITTGELRTVFDPDDTTDAAGWFSLDEILALRRVPLVDYVLSLVDPDRR
jgi:ADP-ribose pyrophosphatase YjhB (NUDIX family)